jgi:hypothetical protein
MIVIDARYGAARGIVRLSKAKEPTCATDIIVMRSLFTAMQDGVRSSQSRETVKG